MRRCNDVLARGAGENKSVLRVVLDSLPTDEARLEFLRESCIASSAPAFQSKPRNAVQVPRTLCGEVSRVCAAGLAALAAWLRVAQPVRQTERATRQLPSQGAAAFESPNVEVQGRAAGFSAARPLQRRVGGLGS